jgi:hypothetical protein
LGARWASPKILKNPQIVVEKIFLEKIPKISKAIKL